MVGNNNKRSRIDTRKPKRRLRKRIKFILLPMLLAFFAVTFYGAYLYIKADSALSGAFEDGGRDKSDLRDDYVDPKFDNVSILIMGVDENEGRKGREIARTDALVLATLNKDEKSIKLLSIPRDSYVYIPEVGYEDKINHAHAFGGTYATIETVERLLDIPVDYYVKLNFHAFVDVIDAIGGIEADVPYEVKESDSGDHRDSIHLLPGKQILDGEEALAFARTRKKDSDVERGKRQLELIDSVINKSTSVTSVFKYDDIIEAVGNNLSTNMTFTEMKSFFSYATHGSKLNVEKLSLEGYDYQPENIYYWQLDDDALQETINMLKGHLELSEYVDSFNESTEFESADPSINN
ncbi:LCP family protein [Pseudogracilibacillus auburnensis]|uniref:LytR family transcriptional attenuator n=1 Tax=Pseudogracilibacillus auburnensis TaxID=1494959 RepID=A0A2V3WAU5_9BACI|nr:LCP family protein [Pseudogracilibacillus auburnensis]PXW85869.1 LytR family transcriptional attenuator [Pseudogracilibacillus auburnensis]